MSGQNLLAADVARVVNAVRDAGLAEERPRSAIDRERACLSWPDSVLGTCVAVKFWEGEMPRFWESHRPLPDCVLVASDLGLLEVAREGITLLLDDDGQMVRLPLGEEATREAQAAILRYLGV